MLYCNKVVLDRQDYTGIHDETIEFGRNYCFANLLLKSEFSKKVYSLRRWRFYLLPLPPRDAV